MVGAIELATARLDRDRSQPVGGQSACVAWQTTGRLRSGGGRRHAAPDPGLTPQCPSFAMRPQSQALSHNHGAHPLLIVPAALFLARQWEECSGKRMQSRLYVTTPDRDIAQKY